jgi:hypothetical protein
MEIIYKTHKRPSQSHYMKIEGGGYVLDLTDPHNPTPYCTVRFQEEEKYEGYENENDRDTMELKFSVEEVWKLEEKIKFFKHTLEKEKNQGEQKEMGEMGEMSEQKKEMSEREQENQRQKERIEQIDAQNEQEIKERLKKQRTETGTAC